MKVEDVDLVVSLLVDKQFYWVKLNIHTKWQPGIWDASKERFKLHLGGYKHLRYIEKIDFEILTHRR